MPDLEEPLQRDEEGAKPFRSLYDLWKDFGVSISAEEIDEARRQRWENFPREAYNPECGYRYSHSRLVSER